MAERRASEESAAERLRRPAFYAAGPGRAWREWWTVLHPPYTAWHLGYVVIGASLAPEGDLVPLAGSLLAFFLAVGVAAHCLDELHGRPLSTSISSAALGVASVAGLGGAVALGVFGVLRVGLVLLPFIVVGVVLVVAYDMELFHGAVHRDAVFALSWGSFPVLVGYVAEARTLAPAAVLAAAAAYALSRAQRSLSARARLVRRSADHVEGVMVTRRAGIRRIDEAFLIEPLEQALHALSWGVVALAASLALVRFA